MQTRVQQQEAVRFHNKSLLYCRGCNRRIICWHRYNTHCEGKAHILKLQAQVRVECGSVHLHEPSSRVYVVQVVQTYEAANRRSLYCRVCKVEFDDLEEFQAHRASAAHKETLAMERKAAFCVCCKKQFTSVRRCQLIAWSWCVLNHSLVFCHFRFFNSRSIPKDDSTRKNCRSFANEGPQRARLLVLLLTNPAKGPQLVRTGRAAGDEDVVEDVAEGGAQVELATTTTIGSKVTRVAVAVARAHLPVAPCTPRVIRTTMG